MGFISPRSFFKSTSINGDCPTAVEEINSKHSKHFIYQNLISIETCFPLNVFTYTIFSFSLKYHEGILPLSFSFEALKDFPFSKTLVGCLSECSFTTNWWTTG